MDIMETAMPREPAHIAREYVEAVGDKELGKVEALLAPNVVPRARTLALTSLGFFSRSSMMNRYPSNSM